MESQGSTCTPYLGTIYKSVITCTCNMQWASRGPNHSDKQNKTEQKARGWQEIEEKHGFSFFLSGKHMRRRGLAVAVKLPRCLATC